MCVGGGCPEPWVRGGFGKMHSATEMSAEPYGDHLTLCAADGIGRLWMGGWDGK